MDNLKEILLKVGPYLTTALWVIIIWLAATDILEMAVTEWRYIYNSLPGSWRMWALIVLLFLSTSILTKWQNAKKRFFIPFLVVVCILFVITLVSHYKYTKYYQWLQEFPKLKSISTTETVQAEKVEIIGKNFGKPGSNGSVKVGNVEFIIVYWDDEKVIVEQPVPNRYFLDDMVLKNSYGNELIIQNFAIKDPSELW